MEFEFRTLGRDFHTRGARLDEQLALLRAMWSSEAVTFNGREHRIDGAGLNPLPVQRPIPLWVGGGVRASVRRAGERAACGPARRGLDRAWPVHQTPGR